MPAEEPAAPRLTLEIPIEWMPGHTSPGNRIGDPGIAEVCPEPTCLYLFTWLQTSHVADNPDADKYEFCFIRKEAITSDEWQAENNGSPNSSYRLKSTIKINITAPAVNGYTDDTQIGRTYAIASRRPLSTTQLEEIVGTNYKSVLASPGTPVEFGKTAGEGIDAQLRGALLDLNAAKCEGGTAWTQANLRDLYSTPHNETKRDNNNLLNGRIIYNATTFPGTKMGHGAVRLYHAAAKIDFQWEVVPALQATTAIASIEVKNLPTQCRIFSPTNNPAGTQSYTINASNPDGITIHPGNKWIGRRYFYALQPTSEDAANSGRIDYTVSFEDVDGTGSGTQRPSKDLFFKPGTMNEVFTAWYRIPAMVKD